MSENSYKKCGIFGIWAGYLFLLGCGQVIYVQDLVFVCLLRIFRIFTRPISCMLAFVTNRRMISPSK